MVNDKINDPALQNEWDKYTNGYYIKLGRETIVQGYNMAGLFPKVETPAKKATIVDEVPIDEFIDPIDEKKRKLAKGAEARRIRGVTVTPAGLELSSEEVIFEMENEDLKDPSVNLSRIIQSMSYTFATYINQTAIDAVREHAVEVDDSKIIGKWDDPATEFKSMARDIRRFTDTMVNKPYNIDIAPMGIEADFELKTKAYDKTLTNPVEIKGNGFTINNALNVMNTNCFYAGKGIEPGELFGFDSKQPALDIFFQKFDNPKVTQAPVAQGLEALAPPIKMLMYDNYGTESHPTTTIKMCCAFAAYPVTQGERMLRLKGSLLK